MNLIVNLVSIIDEKQVSKYDLKIKDRTILDEILRQVSIATIESIVIIVNDFDVSIIQEYVGRLAYKDKVSFKILKTDEDKKIAKDIILTDIVSAYRNFREIDLDSYFDNKIDKNQSTVVLDGTKLYKKNILNFSNCNYDAFVKFNSKNEKEETNYMLFLKDTGFDKTNEIKRIDLIDYDSNFIDITNIETIINSSNSFMKNKKLVFEYVNDLYDKLEYDKVLTLVQKYAHQDGYWALFYLELLEGFGLEYEFESFYKQNQKMITTYNFTKTQIAMYRNIFNLFEAIDTEQQLVSVDIREYLFDENVDFNYIISSINNSKSKQLSTSYLSKNLILSEKLNCEQAYRLIELFESLNVNPQIKLKNIVDICDYFFTASNINKLEHRLMNKMFNYLLKSKSISEFGISERLKTYTEILKLKPRVTSAVQVNQGLSSQSARVAVCISGMANYNFEKNLERLESMLSKNLEVDYFVQMWDKYEYFPGLAEYKLTPDYDWAHYYLSRLRRIQPQHIIRQANLEALLPQTSKLLFSKEYHELRSKVYTDQLEGKVVSLKKYNFDSFLSKIKFSNSKYDVLNKKIIKYFERSKVQSLLETYVSSSGQTYDYVINIDVNTALKSPIFIEDLQTLSDNQIHLFAEPDDVHFGVNYSVTTYNTAKYINSLWNICQESQNGSPYLSDNNAIADINQDPMLLHMLYGKLDINLDLQKFGNPYINKKIVLPSLEKTVNSDLEEYEGDSEQIKTYFKEVERIFARTYTDNKNYQAIKSVKLLECKITETGVVLELSIKGENLKQLYANRFHLHGVSKMNFDAVYAHPRVYKQSFKVLKHDEDEIIVRRAITDNELFVGKAWNFTVLFHDMSLNNFKIEYDQAVPQYELTKYGMKYIKFEDEFTIGIDSKSYLLNEL